MGTPVVVKWGPQKLEVELDRGSEPLTFKSVLYSLTGVEPERQKILFKGKTLGNESWEGFPDLDKGAMLMMMGSASALPKAPETKTKFLEDMTDAELVKTLDVSAGLKNLGNTCYLAATLQCLKTVPELREALKSFRGQALNIGADGGAEAITASVRDLYAQMDKAQEVVPLILVQVLHMVFPRFAEKDDHGHFSQQDANECWVEILRMLQLKLRPEGESVVSKFLGGRFDVTMECAEAADEAPVKSSEDFLSLSCFLAQDTKYLMSGLKGRLAEDIEKRSPTLERDARYTKKSLIARLPGYLTVQMIRFFYKEKDAVNAKILKEVKFPMELDVFELCSPDLQAKLKPMRELYKAADEERALAAKERKKDGAKDVAEDADKGQLVPWSFPDDPGSNNSGLYSLQAILTHKGRSSNSGHYVGWVRRESGGWLMCDDELVRPVAEEDVLKLSGGGDWHSAYILLYGPRPLRRPAKDIPDKLSQSDSAEKMEA